LQQSIFMHHRKGGLRLTIWRKQCGPRRGPLLSATIQGPFQQWRSIAAAHPFATRPVSDLVKFFLLVLNAKLSTSVQPSLYSMPTAHLIHHRFNLTFKSQKPRCQLVMYQPYLHQCNAVSHTLHTCLSSIVPANKQRFRTLLQFIHQATNEYCHRTHKHGFLLSIQTCCWCMPFPSC